MDIERKIELREKCNFILSNAIDLKMSLFPELRYIQCLWNLGIIDYKYIQNENLHILDRYYEESYDTLVRILPKIVELINKEATTPTTAEKLKIVNIISGLETLNMVSRQEHFKINIIPNTV